MLGKNLHRNIRSNMSRKWPRRYLAVCIMLSSWVCCVAEDVNFATGGEPAYVSFLSVVCCEGYFREVGLAIDSEIYGLHCMGLESDGQSGKCESSERTATRRAKKRRQRESVQGEEFLRRSVEAMDSFPRWYLGNPHRVSPPFMNEM